MGRPATRSIYQIAGGLLVIGVVLWAFTWATNRGVRAKKTGFRDIEHMDDDARVGDAAPRTRERVDDRPTR